MNMDRKFFTWKKENFRWVIVAANFLVMIALWTPWASYGVFLPRLAEDLNWNRGTTSVALSIVLIMGAPLGLAIGKIIDKYGPQKLMVLEVLFCSAAFLLGSTTRQLWQLYVYLGVMEGCAFAGAYIIPTTTTARWFDKQRGLALSIVMSATGVAYIIGPKLSVSLMEAYGWRTTFLFFGAGIALVGILPALVLRNPSSAPARPDAGSPPGPPGPGAQRPDPCAPAITLKSAAATSTFWILVFVWLSQAFAQMMFVFHLVPMESDKGIALAVAATALSFYGVGLLLGRVISGPLSDRIGALPVLLGTSAIAALSLAIVVATGNVNVLCAATFFFGIALSGADTAYVRALPDIVGLSALGVLMGGGSLGWRFGGAIGPPFAGFLFDITHIYAIPFGIGIAVLLLGAVLFLVVSRPERQLEHLLAKKAAARAQRRMKTGFEGNIR
ncbi:MAG: MFS transporter [Desulfobacterales bacterium]|nr:MFS transporter [Desulfobacterales bacterium]